MRTTDDGTDDVYFDADFYTTKQIARILNISRSAVYDKANRGVIPGLVRIESTVRIDAAAFDEWLEELREEAR